MHANDQRFLVVRAVEDADPAALGEAPSSCATGSRGRAPLTTGALNEQTWQPFGLTPDMTCLMMRCGGSVSTAMRVL